MNDDDKKRPHPDIPMATDSPALETGGPETDADYLMPDSSDPVGSDPEEADIAESESSPQSGSQAEASCASPADNPAPGMPSREADPAAAAPEDPLAAIRRQVAARVVEEEAQKPEPKPKEPEKKADPITRRFVLDCCWAKDKGAGILYTALMRDKFVYVPERKQWYAWQGHYWKEVFPMTVEASVERVAERISQVISVENDELRSLGEDEGEARNYHKKNLKALRSSMNALHEQKGVNSCMKFALANDDPLLAPADQLDQTPMRLGCENGMVDMRTAELTPGRPTDYVTRLCPVSWSGQGTRAPKWEGMIHEILGEKPEVVRYFHKLIGYAMSGKVTEKLFVILLGEDGDSGKTTIFEILYEIVKGYAAPMPVELLLDQGNMAQNPNAPTPAVMALRGLRLTWASEPGENRRFSVERIKLMSGADSITGRYPWDVNQTTFPPTHTLFLLTNHKMRAAAHDQAFWNRVRLINCPYSFVPRPMGPNQRLRKPGLKDEIVAEEAAGVIAWIVRGYRLYLEEGLEPPAAVLEETALYRREEDIMEDYMETCVEKTQDNEFYAPLGELYDLFKGWHIFNLGRQDLPTKNRFSKMLQKKIRKARVGGEMRFYNVKIKADARIQFGGNQK